MEKNINYTIAKGEALKGSVDFLLKDTEGAMASFKEDIQVYETELKSLDGKKDVNSVIARQALMAAVVDAQQLYKEAEANHLAWVDKSKSSVTLEGKKVYDEYNENIESQLLEHENRINELIHEADELTVFCSHARCNANDTYNELANEINARLGKNAVEAQFNNRTVGLELKVRNAIYNRVWGIK